MMATHLVQDLKTRSDIELLITGTLFDPFRLLGKHIHNNQNVIRVYIPGAKKVFIHNHSLEMLKIGDTDFFECYVDFELPRHYRLFWHDINNKHYENFDPYSFPPQINDFDLHLIKEGKHLSIYNVLGANRKQIDGITGILFATWAPNALRVSVIGDFNHWNGLRHPMRCRGESGIWELFIPEINDNDCYKFEIHNRDSGEISQKADVYARAFELRPKTASLINTHISHHWSDAQWIEQREHWDWIHKPLSIYELHLGSWQRSPDGDFLNYRQLADIIVPYILSLGFTHIELLPITEHPFDGSWGYQTIGYFAPTSRFGTPDDFRYFVDLCHQNNIGVLLDWVVSHFPKDPHGLCRYDGSSLYEHADPQKGEHQDWGTLIFNYGRKEVKNALIANALFWLDEYHLDGLRVDAVASMLYLDYSRKDGEWQPNIYGGNENLEAVSFLQELNENIHSLHPGALVIAEESTSWPQVSRPTYLGGLGFSMKWNMGWMHDTLDYMSKDPIHRRYHHERLTFGMLYAFTENFVLALSHDEVVHEKASLLHKMPGDDWQKMANLRLLYTYMFTYPGKKLLFMGSEFAQSEEWNHDSELDWKLLKYPSHQGISNLVTDLNKLYTKYPALHACEFSSDGFQWIDCHDSDQSVVSYLRSGNGQQLIVVLNFTPIPRSQYRLGVPHAKRYIELLNSDSNFYSGSDVGNLGVLNVESIPWMGFSSSIELTIPPLAGVVLEAQN